MIYTKLQKLIDYSIKKELITRHDIFVVRNMLIDALNLSCWEETAAVYENESIDEILDSIVDFACQNGIIADTANSRDLFDTKIMGIFTPYPNTVIKDFNVKYEQSPKLATDWYYEQSKSLNYVRAGRIAKDLKWVYSCEYGDLDITINCSKPEKDPRDIAMAKAQQSTSYPKCQLCAENAGFKGTLTHPARQNLRPIPITVFGEEWQLQYSPYGYYNEHAIVFNSKHVPMKIDKDVFDKLFDIVDYLPHYFIGSNADLPIVGGSILTHEHFQGGKYTFAMETAPIETEVTIDKYPMVKAGIVKWPMSVIRLTSSDRKSLAECSNFVYEKWCSYSDESVNIFARTLDTRHSTVTPIVRKTNDEYTCDLVLRNNITTPERPLGVYHPNPKLHHIKKENIGLIEVMGLAVLPARLSTEIALLEKAMVNRENISNIKELSSHAEWAEDVLARHKEFSAENARKILEEEIGSVFLEVLCDAGVFKRNIEGRTAFLRFVTYLNK